MPLFDVDTDDIQVTLEDDSSSDETGSDDEDHLANQMRALNIDDKLPRPIVLPSERAESADFRHVRIQCSFAIPSHLH